jgi:hypothetical protein
MRNGGAGTLPPTRWSATGYRHPQSSTTRRPPRPAGRTRTAGWQPLSARRARSVSADRHRGGMRYAIQAERPAASSASIRSSVAAQAELTEPGDRGPGEAAGGEVGERLAPPQREGVSQPAGGDSAHISSTSREELTARPASSRSRASSMRTRTPPTSTGSPSRQTASGPRTPNRMGQLWAASAGSLGARRRPRLPLRHGPLTMPWAGSTPSAPVWRTRPKSEEVFFHGGSYDSTLSR